MPVMPKPSPKKEAPLEVEARAIVEWALRGARNTAITLEFWDDRTHGDGQHDYWIGPGRWGALEVTTLSDREQANALWMWNKYGPKSSDRVEGLTGAWSLMVDQRTKPKLVMPPIRTWLPEAERMGISLIPWTPLPTAPRSVLRLAASGVMYGRRFELQEPDQAGFVTIARMVSAVPRPPADPNHVVTAIDEVLLTRHRGDVEKLLRAQARERHLFMWVSPMTRLDVARAMDAGIPTRPPNLPAGITDLWVADRGGPVLHWSTGSGWLDDRE
jgi:hypothetical protein